MRLTPAMKTRAKIAWNEAAMKKAGMVKVLDPDEIIETIAPFLQIEQSATKTVEAWDMYVVAKALAKGYSHTDDAIVTDEDISTAYRVVCSLPYLFCPMYLLRETQALRDKEQASLPDGGRKFDETVDKIIACTDKHLKGKL